MSNNSDSHDTNYRNVVLTHEPVELYKILKFESLASSGAEAKLIIDDGHVRVNGEIEYRRRRKIVRQDLIEIDGLSLKMIRDDAG